MIYIFEGMDNCLKDTLIQLLRSHLSPQTQILKFSNPPKNIDNPENWQKAHFKDMFDLIGLNLRYSTRNLILNRAHIGEYVYSPIYRGYEGNWIFDLEELFLNASKEHVKKLKLFLLYDSDNFQLNSREDGKSLSRSDHFKMDRERTRFLEAFEKSRIPCKKVFNLSNYQLNETDDSTRIDVNSILKQMLDF